MRTSQKITNGMAVKMKANGKYRVYGNIKYRGKCISEDAVHIAFVAWIRHHHSDEGSLLIHAKNEGKRTPQQVAMDKKMGSITKGASDIIIPGNPAFVCELKRDDPTKCHWQPGQEDYLNIAHEHGAFACVAFGLDAAKYAFIDWQRINNQ